MFVIFLSFLTLAALTVGFDRGGRDWQSSARFWKGSAVRQRARADDLQRRLTRRVLQVRQLQRSLRAARHTVTHRPDSLEAIRLASIAYGVSYGLLERRARCETGGDFSPKAKNPTSTASGLFQFLYPSTWRSTPYGGESVWSPYANALAAAWMEAHGRGGEWVCR